MKIVPISVSTTIVSLVIVVGSSAAFAGSTGKSFGPASPVPPPTGKSDGSFVSTGVEVAGPASPVPPPTGKSDGSFVSTGLELAA